MSEQKRRKSVTIYDVAKEAGVSPSTVSRAFSRPGRVNAETSELIHSAAAKLGYRAKPVLRPEVGVEKNCLGLVVADITNPVYAHIMRGFQREAADAGYTVLLIDSQEDGRAEYGHIQTILPLVDGLVLSASRLTDSAVNQIVKVVPVVATNRIIAGLPSVVPDSGRGMRRAIEHLASLGHTRLTYLAGPEARGPTGCDGAPPPRPATNSACTSGGWAPARRRSRAEWSWPGSGGRTPRPRSSRSTTSWPSAS